MEYRSTPEEMQAFMGTNVWADFKHELDAWLHDIHEAMEDRQGITADKTWHRLCGNAETVHNMLGMPEIIKANIEDDLERER